MNERRDIKMEEMAIEEFFRNAPKSSEVISIDPDEFRGTIEYALMVSENEMLEEIPAIEQFAGKEPPEEGMLPLENDADTRFMLAAISRFRGDPEKAFAFVSRWRAIFVTISDARLSAYITRDGESIEWDGAILQVAAGLPLQDDATFNIDEFLAKIRELKIGHAD